MGFYYIRRKDNPLWILASGYATAPGQIRSFHPETHEEVEGELPEGWQPEPKAKKASDYLDALSALFQAVDLATQYAFLQPMSGVTSASQRGNIPLMRYIIEQENVPPEFEEVKQTMLSVFEEVS